MKKKIDKKQLAQLRERAQKLMKFVARQNKDGKKYKLYSPWGHQLQLAGVDSDGTFYITHPIMKFKTDITEENLDHIESELNKFFGISPEETP